VTILVSGGAGYIGSHAAKLLAQAGFNPVVLDNLSRGHRPAVKWGPFVFGDIVDSHLVSQTIQEYNVRAVLHFAASAYVGESMSSPRSYFLNNVRNTLNFLEAVVESGIKSIVFSSTCATYGIPETLPIAENHPQRPVNPYGDSKLFVERVLHWYGQAYGLRSVVLRYFNAAGADPDGDIGEEHEPETHLIPRVIHAAVGKLPEVEIFGSDYDTPDGTAIRDYIHVSDLAHAHVLALKYLLSGGASCALNLGTGKGHSVLEVIRTVERESRRSIQIKLQPRRDGDPPVLVAQSDLAKAALNWSPHFSSLQTIVQTALAWEISRFPSYPKNVLEVRPLSRQIASAANQ
jgi:UDP-arabinose 4-epimerase